MSDFPYGSLIKNISVTGTDISIFSNGSESFMSKEISVDRHGAYLGIKYQCIEFVRRFIELKHQVNLAKRWRAKNASDWYSNRSLMMLESVDIQESLPGDIITFTGGDYGHIGIISNVDKDGLTFCGQNLFNNTKDAAFFLPFSSLYNYLLLDEPKLKAYSFQSVLRLSV